MQMRFYPLHHSLRLQLFGMIPIPQHQPAHCQQKEHHRIQHPARRRGWAGGTGMGTSAEASVAAQSNGPPPIAATRKLASTSSAFVTRMTANANPGLRTFLLHRPRNTGFNFLLEMKPKWNSTTTSYRVLLSSSGRKTQRRNLDWPPPNNLSPSGSAWRQCCAGVPATSRGGYASKRSDAFIITLLSHAGGFVLMLSLALLTHASYPSASSRNWALLAGALGGTALADFLSHPRQWGYGTSQLRSLLFSAPPSQPRSP